MPISNDPRRAGSPRQRVEEGRQESDKGRRGVPREIIERGRQSLMDGLPEPDLTGDPLQSQVSDAPADGSGSGLEAGGSDGGDR